MRHVEANVGIKKALLQNGVYEDAHGLRIEILETCQGANLEHMRAREQYWIDKLKPTQNRRNEVASKSRRP